jgi:hypothetical protein
MTAVPWKLWEGQVVDLCFPLRRYLGGTDRSAVYLTRYGDPDPRNAAIKLVLAERDVDPAAQWERAAQLSHPNLLPLLRTGRWQVNQLDLRYAVTEYAEENLAEVLADRPLTAAEVRDLAKPLLDALAYIHAEGLVHGHVKPANIMAVEDTLKLTVDGVSLVGEPGSAPVRPGPYDPPEFRDRGCSPVGDVWSFGVTLVHALTRQFPTLGGPKKEVVLPEAVPAEFLPIVRACLRPDPRRRASLDEIVDLFGQEARMPAAEVVEDQPVAPRKRVNPVLVGVAAVALAGILVVPRLLHHPAASAQTEQALAVPASTPADTVSKAPPAVKPAPAAAVAPATPAPVANPPVENSPAKNPPVAERPAPAPRTRESAVEAPPGQVLHQVMPDVPDFARRTIHGMVKIHVRASVDAAGHVTDARVESQNSRYFAKLALEAARQWDFAGGSGDWLLRFEFTPAGATVHPSRLAR